MINNQAATLLVQLYADFNHQTCCPDYDYAEAVALAIAALSNKEETDSCQKENV